MAVYTAEIQKLYVAYFNRPADYEGLAHWEKVLTANNGNVAAVSAFFAASPEYKDQVAGKSFYQIVNQIYNNLFNRDADVTGLEFWAARLREGTFTVDQIVKIIADNASDTDAKDKTTYANKVAAATAFTTELNTASEIIGYSGNNANTAAKQWLSTIGTAESLAAATSPAALQATVTAVAQSGSQQGGTSFTLTKGLDNLPGTSGNDVFVAAIDGANPTSELNTLSSIDIINGGTGTDFLRIQHASSAAGTDPINLGSLNSIEVIQIDSAATAGVIVDSSNTTGVNELAILKAAGSVTATAGGSTDIVLNGKESTAALTHTLKGGNNVTVTLTEMGSDVALNADTITVGTNTGGVVTNAAKGNVVVNAAGKAYDAAATGTITMGAINVNGGKTITVNQTAATSKTAAASDLSATSIAQGNININTDATTTTVTVKQDARATAKPAAYSTGGVTETATVKFAALKAGATMTINGLTFTAAVDMTGAQVATAFANLVEHSITGDDTQSGGRASWGTYSNDFDVTKWTSGAANGDTVVFTSVTKNADVTDLTATLVKNSTDSAEATVTTVQGSGNTATATGGVAGVTAGAVVVAGAAGAALKTVTIDGYSTANISNATTAALDTVNLSNGGAATIAAAAETLNLNLKAVGSSTARALLDLNNAATKTLNVTSTGGNVVSLDLAGATATTTLNVKGTGLLDASVATDLKNVTTIKVTETAGLNLGTSERATVTSVDTTGTTGTVTVGITGAATYTGGAGVDKVTVTNADTAIAKAITLGAGNDVLTLTGAGALVAPTATLSGGDGDDTIAMTAANAVALSANGTFAGKIDGFEILSLTDKATAVGTVNMANMDNINYVISANSDAAASAATNATFTVTLTGNAAAGDKLEFNGATVNVGGATTSAQLAALLGAQNFNDWTVKSISGSTVTFEAKTSGAGPTAPANTAFVFTDDSTVTANTLTGAVSGFVAGAAAGTPAAALTIDNLVNNGTLELTAAGAGAIVKIANAGTGTADVLNVVVSNDANVGTVTAANVETINVKGTGVVALNGTTALTTVNVNSTDDLTVSLPTSGANTNNSKVAVVNASASEGNVTVDLSAHNGVAVTVTGGAGDDVLTASAGVNAHGDILIGGAGADTLVAGSNNARLTGGAGEDLFVLSTATKEANTYSIVTDFSAGDLLQMIDHNGTNVSKFMKLSAELNETTSVFLNFANAAIEQAKAGEAVWFSFGGNSYVVIDNGAGPDGNASFVGGTDSVIQLAGVNTLENVSFNTTFGTIGLV